VLFFFSSHYNKQKNEMNVMRRRNKIK